MNTSREKILNEVRKATRIKSQIPSTSDDIDQRIVKGLNTITPKSYEDLKEQFKNELELVSGEFHLIHDLDEAGELISNFLLHNKYRKLAITREDLCKDISRKIIQRHGDIQLFEVTNIEWPARKTELASVSVSLVQAVFAIANTGSLVFQYDKTGTSLPHFLSDTVFVLINQRQIIANQYELFEKLSLEEMKNMFIVTGPSRTADIEKILILGAHGPRKLIVLMWGE